MRVVAEIAVALAQWTGARAELVQAAAWLHDLVRIREQWPHLPASITVPLPHAEINYLLLRDQWSEVAAVIRPHSLMTIVRDQPFATLEDKILYYADKRVNHATIVSLTERLDLGYERWQVTTATDQRHDLLPRLQQLEKELFSNAPITPDELQTYLQNY
jgi:hypothetical protein